MGGRAMKIIFTDGEAQECSPDDQREISIAEVLIRPQRVPKHLKRVWADPPTYAKLAVVRCGIIVPDHYVMTSSGLKRVAKVEK
jgi:hypothetical protein